MSKEYDLYLREHRVYVRKGFLWLVDNLPDIVDTDKINSYQESKILYFHDKSKEKPDEYPAYDEYFYGNNRSAAVVAEYERAWLTHIHKNPHHWQYYILHCDDPREGVKVLDMPYHYIVEMICDWWSFSWKTGDLYEIFKWYDDRKEYIMLSERTRKTVNDIFNRIKQVLDEGGDNNGSK